MSRFRKPGFVVVGRTNTPELAAYGREDLLIQVAAQLEQAPPWAHRRARPAGAI